MNNFIFISGGPCTGKTSVINELKENGYNTVPEAAREISANDLRFAGKSIRDIDMRIFQNEIFNLQKRQIESLIGKKEFFFFDRGFGDTLAYRKLHGFDTPHDFFDYAGKFQKSMVFILEPLGFYKTDELRTETREEQKEIHEKIISAYRELKHPITFVPLMNTNKRAEFIIQKTLKGT